MAKSKCWCNSRIALENNRETKRNPKLKWNYNITAEIANNASVNITAVKKKGIPIHMPPSCKPHCRLLAIIGPPIIMPPETTVVTPIYRVPICIGSTMSVRKLLVVAKTPNPEAKIICPKIRLDGESARKVVLEPSIRHAQLI